MPGSGQANRAELADVGRLARRLLSRAVETARTEDQPLRRLLLDHLGPDAALLPTVSATWPSYEHVNVQVALDAWLASGADGGRGHEVYGITGIGFMSQMEVVGIGDFLQGRNEGPFSSAGVGGVMTMAVPSGPDGQTYACVRHGVYLVRDGEARLVVVLQPVTYGSDAEVVLQIAGDDPDKLAAVLAEIQRLTTERSVFRRQVISFGPEVFGAGRQAPMNFLERPAVGRDQIVLPDDPAREHRTAGPRDAATSSPGCSSAASSQRAPVSGGTTLRRLIGGYAVETRAGTRPGNASELAGRCWRFCRGR